MASRPAHRGIVFGIKIAKIIANTSYRYIDKQMLNMFFR